MSVPPSAEAQRSKKTEEKESVVIRFAGDSGDGMQLTGMQFTTESALAGNDIATLPDFPAEIRAPAGTLAGVCGFQLQLRQPGGLHAGRRRRRAGGDEPGGAQDQPRRSQERRHPHRQHRGVQRAEPEARGLRQEPARGRLARPLPARQGRHHQADRQRLQDLGLSNREALRCKNFFALGLISWMYHRPIESTEHWIHGKFKKNPELVEANLKVLHAGYHYGETAELFAVSYEVQAGGDRAGLLPQHHRQQRHRARLRGGEPQGGIAAVPRQLSDHAGVRHPARALDVQALRRDHLPGRGRDRGRRMPRSARRSADRSASPRRAVPA